MLRARHRLVRSHTDNADLLFLPSQVSPTLCFACRQLYGRLCNTNFTDRRNHRKIESNGPAYSPSFHNDGPQRSSSSSSGNWGRRDGTSGRGRSGGDGGHLPSYCGHRHGFNDANPTTTFEGDRCTPSQREADAAVSWQEASLSKCSARGCTQLVDTTSAASATATAASCRSFWSQNVRHVSAGELKRQHTIERTHDKRSRFLVRNRIRDDGVLSNLFPVLFHDEAAVKANCEKKDPYLYIYEMYVTRTVTPKATSAATAEGGIRRSASWNKYKNAASSYSGASSVQLSNSNQSNGTSSSKTSTTSATIRTVGSAPQPVERRVAAGRSWRAIQRFLRHRFTAAAATLLPPLIQLENKIYAAGPLPADALELPKTYLDIGWKKAELRLVGRSRYTDLPASELQMVLNKIILEAARSTQAQQQENNKKSKEEDGLGVLEVVREKTGKLVCTTQGVSSGGLRVYRGIYVQAIFVDHATALGYGEDLNANEGEKENCVNAKSTAGSSVPSPPPLPPTRHLAETPVGLTDAAHPIQFRVDAFLRAFTYRGTPVESYLISDSSGSVLASVWAPPQPQSLMVGGVYSAAPVRVREFAARGNARLIELPSGTVPALLAAPQPSSSSQSHSEVHNTKQQQQGQRQRSVSTEMPSNPPSRLPGHISLKIDTKGTIASEISLWGEVLQHYGPGPYDEPTQQRIQKVLVNMPVVISYSLRQGIVRDVRFDGAALLAAAATSDSLLGVASQYAPPTKTTSALPSLSSDAATSMTEADKPSSRASVMGAREPRLLPLLPFLDAQQPCAVLADYTVVPLQVLHCCFDPTMKSRQDIGISFLSLLPKQRTELLSFVQKLLSTRLRRWGLDVARRPWRTKSLSLLPAPMKYVVPKSTARSAAMLRANFALPPTTAAFPSTIAVLGIAGPRCTADQTQRVSLTVQYVAQYFRTNLAACLTDESAGVQYVHERLMMSTHASQQQQPDGPAGLRDVNSCVLLITTEPGTRATRWLKVECLSRGIHLLTLLPSSTPNKLNLLCGGLRRQITTQFELDPLRGIDLRAEVPVLGRRRVLIIGVDTCHTNTHSIGTIVGILSTPDSNHLLSHFWQHNARGRETSNVAMHFKNMLKKVLTIYGGVDEVIVFQDGDVFSELAGMKEELAVQLPGCGLTFMCLHKRCNIRFTHTSSTTSTDSNVREEQRDTSVEGGSHNVVKGVVITGLAPIPLDYEVAAPSFYLQAHESAMSTTRTVQYTVHHVSPTLDVADVQQIANAMANVLAPQATKLPMSTRCAHRLADRAERLLDAVPQFTGEMIPRPLSDRLWFL